MFFMRWHHFLLLFGFVLIKTQFILAINHDSPKCQQLYLNLKDLSQQDKSSSYKIFSSFRKILQKEHQIRQALEQKANFLKPTSLSSSEIEAYNMWLSIIQSQKKFFSIFYQHNPFREKLPLSLQNILIDLGNLQSSDLAYGMMIKNILDQMISRNNQISYWEGLEDPNHYLLLPVLKDLLGPNEGVLFFIKINRFGFLNSIKDIAI